MIGIWLITLHMLGDFILQTNWIAANKFVRYEMVYRSMMGEPSTPSPEPTNFAKAFWVRTLHVVLYVLPFIPVLLWLGYPDRAVCNFAAWVFVLHWITDCRRWASDKPWPAKPIMVDQTLHLLQLAVCASLYLR